MTLEEVLSARARGWIGASETECAEHIDWLIERVRVLEKSHAWFVENVTLRNGACGECDYCGCEGQAPHKEDCEWVKAKELRL